MECQLLTIRQHSRPRSTYPVDIIAKKRDGHPLTAEEIDFFVQGFTQGEIPDYQAASLLMAIYLKGMNERETADLTISMARSGKMMDLSVMKQHYHLFQHQAFLMHLLPPHWH